MTDGSLVIRADGRGTLLGEFPTFSSGKLRLTACYRKVPAAWLQSDIVKVCIVKA